MSWNNSTPLIERAWDPPRERAVLLPSLTFFLTFLTTTLAGADLMLLFRQNRPMTLDPGRYVLILQSPSLWLDGLLFSVPLLAILIAHEMGHFLACE